MFYKIFIAKAPVDALVFTALHGMQTRSSDEISVRPSVCLSVRLSNACIVTNMSKFLYDAKDHSVYFSEKKYGGWGRPLLSEILGQTVPRGSKTQNGRFPSKIALRLKKVCYKVSLCENCQRQSCRAFTFLTVHAKNIGGDVKFTTSPCVHTLFRKFT